MMYMRIWLSLMRSVLNELGETDQPTIEGSGEINVKAAAVQSDNIAYEDAKDIAIGKLN